MGVVCWGRMSDWNRRGEPSRKPENSGDNRPEVGGAPPSGNKSATNPKERGPSEDVREAENPCLS